MELGMRNDRAVVVTETAKVVGVPLVSVMGFATVQVAPAGAPEQAIVTVPEKPGPGVSCTLYVAVWPAVTVAVRDEALVTVNALALIVPVTVTLCGELLASSAIRIVSVLLLALIGLTGAKLTAMVQLALGAIAAVQALAGFTNSATSGPLNVTPVTCRGAVPELVTVKFIGALVTP